MARIGILVDSSGVCSVAVLSDSTNGRAEGLRLLERLQPEVDAFDRRLRALASGAKGSGPGLLDDDAGPAGR